MAWWRTILAVLSTLLDQCAERFWLNRIAAQRVSNAKLPWSMNVDKCVSNHRLLDFLSSNSKKTSKLFITGACEGNRWRSVESPHKGPTIRKPLPHYNDVIMGTIASQFTKLRECLRNRLFGRRSKKTSMIRVTGLCAGNSPVPAGPGEFPAQRASNAENVSIWWRHRVSWSHHA